MNRDSEITEVAPSLTGLRESSGSKVRDQSRGLGESHFQLTPFQKTIVDSLLLVCALAMVSFVTIRPSTSMDEDLWWHLRTGNWIIQHRSVPVHDSFASYTMGKTWIAYSWLFEVLVSGIYGRWGMHGILTFTELFMLACIAGIIVLLSRYVSVRRAMALGTAALWAMLPLASPRPWVFTILFFILELYLLLQARERGRAAWMWPIVPLFAVWANIHIQFVYGLGLIGLFALERPLGTLLKWPTYSARLHAQWFWALLAVSTLATLANPYGWNIYAVVRQYAAEAAPLQLVHEMHALGFRSVTDWTALLLVCSAFFAQAKSRNNSPLMLLLLVVSCWFGFRAARDVWFLAIASTLAVASGIGSPEETHMNASRWKEWTIALPISLTLAFAALGAGGVDEGNLRKAAEKRFPERAAEYVDNHQLPGPLYNSYNWGGYLIWRLPNMPVSIDGRANLHGDDRLTRWADTYSGKRDWAADPTLAKANTILLERDCALASILRSDVRYRLLYEDDVASVFRPVRTGDVNPQAEAAETEWF